MNLKENWNSNDKLSEDDFNEIIEVLNKIDDKLLIQSEFVRIVKRNIQIGDDLSGKTIYCEFPDNLYESIVNDIISGQADVITTANHSILEYSNLYNNVATVSVDFWMDNIYYANTHTGEVYNNQVEFQLNDDFGVVTNINSNLTSYSYMYIYEKQAVTKDKGDFIIAEELQKLEDNIEEIAQAVDTSFVKRDWYYLSVISYEDINRWSIVLNKAYSMLFIPSENIVTEADKYILTEEDEYLMTEEE